MWEGRSGGDANVRSCNAGLEARERDGKITWLIFQHWARFIYLHQHLEEVTTNFPKLHHHAVLLLSKQKPQWVIQRPKYRSSRNQVIIYFPSVIGVRIHISNLVAICPQHSPFGPPSLLYYGDTGLRHRHIRGSAPPIHFKATDGISWTFVRTSHNNRPIHDCTHCELVRWNLP